MFQFFGLIIIVALTTCKKENEGLIAGDGDQNILFQYEYVNFAWGHQHSGWIIDSSGNVYCYNLPENWNRGDSLGYISETELNENILNTDTICYRIDKNELKNKLVLMEEAAKGEITDPVHLAYDAGSSVYIGFLYDKNKKEYKRIILHQFGDYKIENTSEAALELTDWLKNINALIL